MKRKILTGLVLTLTVVFFVIFSGFNSDSETKRNTFSSDSNVTNELIQGVFELLPPFQGLAIYLDDYFLICYGMSDSLMIGAGGKYEISGDTINDIFLFSTNPNMADNTKWTAEKLEYNTIKGTMYNPDGSIMGVFNMSKKVDATDELKSQMKDIEGFYQYVAPNRGLSTMIGGYYIYLFGQPDGAMTAQAGKYKVDKDKTTCKNTFATDPQAVGVESDWIKKSVIGNTLTWATIDGNGEITSTGKSVRPE